MTQSEFRALQKSLIVQADGQAIADRIKSYGIRHKSRHITKAQGRKSYRAIAHKPGTIPLKPGTDAFGRTHRGDDARTPILRPTPYASTGKYRLPGGTAVLKHTRVA